MPRNSRTVNFWLEQILTWSDRVETYVDGLSAQDFASDQAKIDAASWCISCIGEACGRILEIDPAFESRHPMLSLSAAYAARNRYVHGYFDLDIEQVWVTCIDAVPRLAIEARRILDDGS